MEWVNMIGFILSVSTIIVGLGSFIATCGPHKIESAKEIDCDVDIQMAA